MTICANESFRSEEEVQAEVTENGTVPVVEELPMSGDYSGIGGPESVPLESDGAFEKPSSLGNGYAFLNDLFMAPSDDTINNFQVTERKRLM